MKERYNFICPNCKYEQSAAPSMFMEMGLNLGHGTCMKCKMFLHLEIVPDINGDSMSAVSWDEHMEKEKEGGIRCLSSAK